MNRDNWDEEKIEQLLSNIPKMTDNRPKDEVFQRLKDEGIFEETKPKKKAKNKNWMPYFISVAAALICIILLPSILNNINKDESSDLASSSEQKSTMDVETNLLDSEGLITSVYDEDIENNMLFNIGLVSKDAISVPITVLIPKEQILEDIGNSNPTQLQLYNEYAPLLNEEALGFIDYHPYVGKIHEDKGKLVHSIPNSQSYDVSSATYTAYIDSLKYTFSNYDEIELKNENNNPFSFKEVGVMDKPLQLNISNANYYQYTLNDGKHYLVPNLNDTYKSVENALEAMKVAPNGIYKSVIIDDVDFSTSVDGQYVIVKFNSKMDLNNFEEEKVMQMLEGILLTSASFHKQVRFENVTPVNWKNFDFTKPLPMPIGPNKISSSFLQ